MNAKLLWVLVCFVWIGGDSVSGQIAGDGPPKGAATKAQKSLEELAEQRLVTASDAYALAVKRYQQGVADIEVAITWSQRIAESQRDLHWHTPVDRTAAMRDYVKRTKDFEESIDRRVAAGTAPGIDLLAAKFARLQAEQWVAQDQASFK